MGKRIFAAVVGLIAGFAVTGMIEATSGILYPLPPGFDMKDMEAFRAHVEGLPMGAFLLVLLAHALGSFIAGFACARVAGAPWPGGSVMMGGLLLAAGVVNLMAIPHPAWFAVADVLVYLPMAILGGRVGTRPPAPLGPPVPR